MKPNSLNIGGRMADALERQIAALEEMRVDVPTIEQTLDAEPQTNAQSRREQALANLAKEFDSLKREWEETEGLTASERDRVEALSQRASALASEVQTLVAGAITSARGRMAAIENSMGELRRGKQVMRAYRSRDASEGGGLDRQG